MFKLTLVLVAVAIAMVACNTERDELAERLFQFRKSECMRSVNRAQREMSNYYYKPNMHKNIRRHNDDVFRALRPKTDELNKILKDVNKAKSMILVHDVKTYGGQTIHCSRDIAEKVADVIKRFMQEILRGKQ